MNSSNPVERDKQAYLRKLPFVIYKWVVVGPFLAISTLFLGVIIIVLSLLGAPDFASRVFATGWARLNSAVVMMKVNIRGREKIDPSGSYVIVANHQSLIDIYILYGFLGLDIKWIMKKELRAIPILGIACELMGHIMIDRSNTNAALASINAAREKIRDGMSVVFFPEGTRSRTGELKTFKKGAFRLAQELQIPILPVVIHNSSSVLPSDGVDLTPGTVTLEFCEPIPTHGLEAKQVSNLSRETRETMILVLQAKSPV